MIIDSSAVNPAFADGHLPELNLNELVQLARKELGLNASRPWRLISARRKLSKVLFELEEERPDGPVRFIAKISPEERTRVAFEALRSLWDAGFRPPGRFTVVEPVAYLPKRDLIIVERAPGAELVDLIQQRAANAHRNVQATAEWLARLHGADVRCDRWSEAGTDPEVWARDLSTVLPEQSQLLAAVVDRARRRIPSEPADLVPCHGDFHPLNMFIADNGRLTGIDLDKFGKRDRTEEVAYFLSQTASIGFHRMGSFAATSDLRRTFLDRYRDCSGTSLDPAAMAPYIALTLIKNLHFDLFTYKTGRVHIAQDWLKAADGCLAGKIHLD